MSSAKKLVIALGLMVALCPATAPMAAPVAAAAPPAAQPAPASSKTEALRMLRDDIIGDNRTYDTLRTAFPEDYKAFEDDAVALLMRDGVTPLDFQTLISTFETSIRNKSGPYRKFAPDNDLYALAESQFATVKLLQKGHAGACYELAEHGYLRPETINQLGTDGSKAMKIFAETGLVTAIKGRANQVTHQKVSQKDQQALSDKYFELGGDGLWITNMQKRAGMTPSARCTSGVQFWEALMAQPKDRIVRFMAQ